MNDGIKIKSSTICERNLTTRTFHKCHEQSIELDKNFAKYVHKKFFVFSEARITMIQKKNYQQK